MNDLPKPQGSQAETPAELPHLDTLQSECRTILTASKDIRVSYCFEDKHVLYDEIRDILTTLKDAFSRPRSERPPGFALTGPSNSGKTSTSNRFKRDLGGAPLRRIGPHSTMPLLISKMPPRPDEARIALGLARAMGIPVIYGGRGRELSDLVLRNLAQKEVRMIIFHEFNNVRAVAAQEREVVYHFLKDLNNEGIVVVVVGTEQTIALIQECEELVTRLRPLRLCGFACDTSFVSFLKTLETYYPLPERSGLAHLAEEVYQRTSGVVGDVVQLINEAAAWAIRNDRPVIDKASLAECRYIPPALRPAGGDV